MDAPGDRRAFFKEMLGGLARGAMEAAPALKRLDLAGDVDDPLGEEPGFLEPETVAAAPAARTATTVDLLRLAEDAGLAFRAAEVQALARLSVRLTLADAAAPARASRIGGAPDLPAQAPWPDRLGEPLAFLAQIDLAAAAAAGLDGPLPREGLLLLFWDAEAAPSGLRTVHREATAAVLVPAPAPGADAPPPRGPLAVPVPRALTLSGELTLPRAWHADVQAAGLDDDELAQWSELRDRLAEFQGVELEDTLPEFVALHRLLGYPDETRGDMPLICELIAAGLDAGEHPYGHRRADEFEPRSARWRLLAQLSLDDELRWSWGEGRDRLYVWVDAAALAVGDIGSAWAIPQ